MNQKITLPELVELLARRQRCSRREAETFLREMAALMTEVLSAGDSLRINGLGTFKSIKVEARTSINVQTGEPYVIPSHYKLTFAPAKAVRDAVNEPFSSFCVEILPDDADIAALQAVADEPEGEDEAAEETMVVETPVVKEVPLQEPIEEKETIAPEEIEEELEEIEEEPEEIEEEPEEVVPAEKLSDDDIDVLRKSERRRGFWSGVGVMATIMAVALLCIYLFMVRTPQRETIIPQEDVMPADSLAATAVVSPDTIVIEEAPQEETVVVAPVVTDTVRRGIFLTTLSLRHYGHKAFWVYIYEENKAIITNPDNVPIGTVLVIPPAEKYGIDARDTVAVKKALDIAAVAAWKNR